MLLALLLGACFAPGQRRPIFASALLSAPWGFSSVLFVPEYWNPRRVVSFGAGPEDLIFSFAGGGLVWMLAIHLVSPRPTVSLRLGRVARRYLVPTLSFYALVLAMVFGLGFRTMAAVLLSGAILFVALLFLRPNLGKLALRTGVGYCAAYTLFCAVLFALWPHSLEQWNWDNLSGLILFSVPVEESVWAMAFAACWTLGMGYAFQVRLPERQTGCGS